MFTIAPDPAAAITGPTCFSPRNTPTWLISVTSLYSSSVVSAIGEERKMPALLMKASILP